MAAENRSNTLWPIGMEVAFLDAYGRNPVEGTLIRHYDATNVLVEDERGVRYFGATWRIATAPPSPKPVDLDLDDLLDDEPASPVPDDLDDLLV